MSTSTNSTSTCSVEPATPEDILSYVQEEQDAHKLRLRAADRKLDMLHARLEQVPKGERLYLQERMALEKDIRDQARVKQEIEQDYRHLLRDARQLVASRLRGRQAHVSELVKRGAPPPCANRTSNTHPP